MRRVSGTPLLGGLAAAGGLSLAVWLAALLDPARAWRLEPVAENDRPEEPERWPSVSIMVPARDEASLLPRTLPALLAQDYPGDWRVVLVDDRSRDATAEVARSLAGARLGLIRGRDLPDGWAGKVWALEQGIASAGTPDYLLLTDADIVHAPGSLRALVADAEAGSLDLTSRLARLHCRSLAERLVIPPFVFFFNVLYPMPRVNDPRSRKAAAAGGCMLVRRAALESAGGIRAIRAEIIDDVNLARLLKSSGRRIRLAISRGDVRSIRTHTFRSGWRMVRRTAFDELGYSYARLAATLAGLLLLFAVPPGLVTLALGGFGLSSGWRVALGLLGASAWAVSAIAYLPAIRLYGLARLWALTLPVSGLLYGGMTLDSAARHVRSRAPAEW